MMPKVYYQNYLLQVLVKCIEGSPPLYDSLSLLNNQYEGISLKCVDNKSMLDNHGQRVGCLIEYIHYHVTLVSSR